MSSIVNLISAIQFGGGFAPGASKPNSLMAGYQYFSSLYDASGAKRLALSFSYGYGVFNLSNPSNPTALAYEDMRSDIPPCGDGQSYVKGLNVSADGKRSVLALSSQAVPYKSVVGTPSGSIFTLAGTFDGDQPPVIQKTSDGRYIVYEGNGNLVAADISSPPGNITSASNINYETSSISFASVTTQLQLAGNYLCGMTGKNIGVVDVSSPGTAPHITTNFTQILVSSTDFHLTGKFFVDSFSSCVDPTDPSKLYLLAESTGTTPTFTLLSLKAGVKTFLGSFTIPLSTVAGESWISSYTSALIQNGSDVYALMWGYKQTPTSDGYVFRLFTTTVSDFSAGTAPGSIDFPLLSYPNLVPGNPMYGFASSDGSKLYTYLPTSSSAYAITLSCSSGSGGSGGGTPATIPGVPIGVTATVQNTTTARVGWVTPSDGGNPITGYNITPHNTVTGAQLTAVTAPSGATTFDVTLATNCSYNFYIYASNNVGHSPVATSPTVVLGTLPADTGVGGGGSGDTGTTGGPGITGGTGGGDTGPSGSGAGTGAGPTYTIPGAPTSVTSVVGVSTIALGWVTPSSDGGSPITGYVTSYTVPGNAEKTQTVGVVTNTIISGLIDNETYSIKVAAINATGTGPYSTPQSLTTSTQQLTYPLASWPSFNSIVQTFSNGVTSVPVQFNGLTAISRDSTTSTLYVLPTELYPAYDEIGKVTFRTAFRKKNAYSALGATNYYNPPGFTVVSPDLQNMTANLVQAGLVFGVSPLPDAGNIQDMLVYSARPGDALTAYRKFQSYFAGTAYFQTDRGAGADKEWKTNTETSGCNDPAVCLMPGWAYEYTHTRPFLRFDTRNLSNTNIITGAFLSFKKDPNCPIVNPENLTLKFVKAGASIDDNNLISTDYSNIEGTVLASIPLLDTVLQSGQTISLPIQDLSFIKASGFTKLIITSQFENGTLPSDWTQITLQEVKLNLSIDTSTVTTPGEVSYIIASPSNRNVSLEWGNPLIDGGSAIISYKITNTNTGETTHIVANALQNVYSYDWGSLVNDVDYTFKITASNMKGEGQGSIATATPSATPTLPDVVNNVYAFPEDGEAILSWSPPTETGTSPLVGYYINNQTTGTSYTALPTDTDVTIPDLINGVTYTLSIVAKNATGIGPSTVTTVTPTSGVTVPSRPSIISLYATEGKATLYWTLPVNNGGSSITGWVITLDAPGVPGYQPVNFTLSDVTKTDYTITGIATGNTYLMSVAATNGIGTGPSAISAPFTVSSEITTTGLFVPVDYNYKNFYEAPIELNIQSPNYLETLYPENDDFYAEEYPAYIQSDPNLLYPVAVSPSFSNLYLTITNANGSHEVTINLTATVGGTPPGPGQDFNETLFFPPSVWTADATAKQINAVCSFYGTPILASSVGQRLSLETTEKGDGVTLTLSSSNTVVRVNSANQVVFGNNPVFVNGYTNYPVVNNVPTAEYDATHMKALVESRVWITNRNQDISRPSLYFRTFDTTFGNSYTFDLVGNLRPNSVTIQYFDSTNTIVTLRDYLGDGRILYRLKSSTGPGDPVVFSYPSDVTTGIDPSDGVSGFGKIDYQTGEITNLIFPTFYSSTGVLYPTFKPAIVVGKGVPWPIYVKNDTSLFLDVNGVTLEFAIPGNVGNTSYKAQDISDLLNAADGFRLAGLVAGVIGGQLFIQNIGIDATLNLQGVPNNKRINIGPSYTLVLTVNDGQFLTASGDSRSCNRLLFGMSSTQYTPSKIYVTYSYTNNDPSPYRHIWYSTPHFILRSASQESQFITKGHLDYLLNKLSLFRPASTTLDNIEFVSSAEEVTNIAETFVTYVATGVTLPYIQVDNRRQVTTDQSGKSTSIKVINPDNQENTLTDGYTYS